MTPVSSRERPSSPTGEPSPPRALKPDFVRLERVYKVHSTGETGVAALAGVSLQVREGTSVAIMGPSGAGKSSMLNLIGGLETATAGSVLVDGADLSLLGASGLSRYRRRMVGFLWQGSTKNLLPYLSAEDNVLFPMLLGAAEARSERRERVARLLEVLGVAHCSKRLPSQLSGGEQQRVALAVALANAAPLVLADEPTAELDRESGDRVLEALASARAAFGTTVVVATHDPAVAANADAVYRLLDGRIRSSAGRASLDESGVLRLSREAAALLGAPGEVEVELESGDLRIGARPLPARSTAELPGVGRPVGTPALPFAGGRDGELLSARAVSHSYRSGPTKTAALKDVSLSLASKELLVVTGPSGSGKSTLLGILGGFGSPDEGEVTWGGRHLKDLGPAELASLRSVTLGVIFQALGLLPSLTAEENVVLPLLYSGLGPAGASERARRWLARLGLGDRQEHRVNELSLGQQQRVAVARALAAEPAVVLADEPTAEVDEEVATVILEALREVTARGGGVIVASHDLRLTDAADRVLSLRSGEVEHLGPPGPSPVQPSAPRR